MSLEKSVQKQEARMHMLIRVHDCKLGKDIMLHFPVDLHGNHDPRVVLQRNGYEWVQQVGDGPQDTEKYDLARHYPGQVVAWTVYRPNYHEPITVQQGGKDITYHPRPFVILFHNTNDLSAST